MSIIIFEGNTYTFGATVSTNLGTGTTSYVFGGLTSGSTYGFILWAFNGFGPSSIVGPITKLTTTEIPLEQRANFAAFAWNWPTVDAGYQWTYQWSAYGSTSGPESGSTYNYYTSSEDLGNTNWFGLQSGTVKPAWLNVLSGITDPFGGTGAFILNAQGLTTSQFLRYGQYIGGLPAGKTYIMSMYINTSGTTTNWVTYSQWQAAFASPVGITMRQILPIGASSASGSLAPTINFVNGQTGWQRFAWEFYAYPETKASGIGGSAVAGLTWENFKSYVMERTFSAGVTANIYLYGLQIEEA